MNGIFPDYVGPTVQHRLASLFPDWVGNGGFEVIVEVPGGSGSKKIRDSRASDPMLAQLIREDEEILAIVMVAMRIMQ
jgi:hypothetical protein